MNNVALIGRLTKDPEVRYGGKDGKTAVARYTLAVDRRTQGEADFISIKAFGKDGEFAEKFLHRGMRIAIIGHINTGSYKDKDGRTVYATDVVVDRHEFCESKAEPKQETPDEFMRIPADVDAELPFN